MTVWINGGILVLVTAACVAALMRTMYVWGVIKEKHKNNEDLDILLEACKQIQKETREASLETDKKTTEKLDTLGFRIVQFIKDGKKLENNIEILNARMDSYETCLERLIREASDKPVNVLPPPVVRDDPASMVMMSTDGTEEAYIKCWDELLRRLTRGGMRKPE